MRIEIELSGKCNLACVMCAQAFGYDGRNLTIDEMKKFTPLFTSASEVTLHGAGEIFLSPILEEALALIPENIPIYFLTNGQLLNHKNSNLLMGRPNIKRIMVSIDAFSDEKYKFIRGGNVLKVKQNLIEFIELRNKNNLCFPKVIINATIFKYNIDQLVPLAKFAKELDSELHVWPLLKDAAHYTESWKVKRGDYTFDYTKETFDTIEDQELLKSEYLLLEKYCMENNIDLIFDAFMHMPEKALDISLCKIPYSNRLFFSDGQAKHCCFQTKPLFDWRIYPASSFDKHPRHLAVLESIRANQIPIECSSSGCKYVLDKTSSEFVSDIKLINLDDKGFRGGKLTMRRRKNELKN
jgi:MoaA/NifB/PqqE/SkfB family radical SAM enzyme